MILALPNDHAAPYVAALDGARRETVIVDVSSDHRFDDAWVYGLPELRPHPPPRRHAHRQPRLLRHGGGPGGGARRRLPRRSGGGGGGGAHAFGVSGYSGAGATPSPRNDVEALRDNLMPYALVGHTHEREVSRHAGPVHLMPHVAPFFRGITMTVSLHFSQPLTAAALQQIYERAYEGEPLVRVTREAPLVRAAMGLPHATIGGFAVDPEGTHAVVVSTLDNLLKGAASQAVQNLNLAFGFPERLGIEPWQS